MQPLSEPSRGEVILPEMQVTIEISRWSFLKRGSFGSIDFVSPLPCPYNYGSIATLVGLDGDYLDALVLGRRLARGTRVTVTAFDAIGLTDRGLYDDKLICGLHAPTPAEREAVLRFFHFYARAKGVLNLIRGHSGVTRCEGWTGASEAIGRAHSLDSGRPLPGVRF